MTDRNLMRAPRAALTQARRQLDEYFEGRREDFAVALDWRLTRGFRREVLRATAAIPTSIAIDAVPSTSASTEWSCRPAPPLALMAAVSARRLSLRAVLVLLILRAGGHANLNVRAALLHVLSDLLGSVADIVAALVILWTGWTSIEQILSRLTTVLFLRSSLLITSVAAYIPALYTPLTLQT